MPDNVESNPGSGGVVFATDEIATVHYPRTKVVWGPDGTANDADVASGKPLPVQLRASGGTELSLATAANQTTVIGHLDGVEGLLTTIDADTGTISTNSGTLAGAVAGTEMQVDIVSAGPAALEAGGNLAAAAASLAIVDDWDESDRAKVNPIVGQAGVAAGVGNSGATTQRVVLANSHGKTLKFATVSLSASGNIVAAAGASKSIRVYALAAQSRNDSMTLQVTNGSGGAALSLRWAFNTREGVSRAVNPPAWLTLTGDNTALYATITGTGTIDIEVSYWDDDAA